MSAVIANIAHGLVGQTLQVHTLAGPFAGTLEAVIGGVMRIRGGGTVYDVDLAHVVAISYPAAPPAPAQAVTYVRAIQALLNSAQLTPNEGRKLHHNGQGQAA